MHRVTFQEAVADGLYRRVCLRLGKVWTSAEAAWMADVYAFYGDGAPLREANDKRDKEEREGSEADVLTARQYLTSSSDDSPHACRC